MAASFCPADDERLLCAPERVDSFQLAAVDRNAGFAEQLKASAQHHELTPFPEGLFYILLYF
jgi:hypothetical protein